MHCKACKVTLGADQQDCMYGVVYVCICFDILFQVKSILEIASRPTTHVRYHLILRDKL